MSVATNKKSQMSTADRISRMFGKRCLVERKGIGRVVGSNKCTVGDKPGTTHPVIVLLDNQRLVLCRFEQVDMLH